MDEVRIPSGQVMLDGNLLVPEGATGVVLFAHGSGSSRHSKRNQYVAQELNQCGLGTLLMDLLTPEEERVDEVTRALRFDIPLLGARLVDAVDFLESNSSTRKLSVGTFGASTGAAAALIAAAERPEQVRSVVSRGGRPDLAAEALARVEAPTLLIVGSLDQGVIELNEEAFDLIAAEDKRLEIVPQATHLFPEPGALERVAELCCEWFGKHLPAKTA